MINSSLPFVLVLAFSLCVQQNRKYKLLNSNRTLQQFFTLAFRDIKPAFLAFLAFSSPVIDYYC